MVAVVVLEDHPRWPLHPLHAVLLAGALPLFLGALASDLAYSKTFEIQWINFAAWLNAGGLLFAGLALVFALVGFFRGRRGVRGGLYLLVLAATFVVGVFAALVHARDAWATMPTALTLSAIVAGLALVATALGVARSPAGGVP